MPSASAMATPLLASSDSPGRARPWQSWLAALRPAAEYWPAATLSGMSGDGAARRRLQVRGVQRQAGEGQATDQVAQHGGDLVPDQVVEQREMAAQHQAR